MTVDEVIDARVRISNETARLLNMRLLEANGARAVMTDGYARIHICYSGTQGICAQTMFMKECKSGDTGCPVNENEQARRNAEVARKLMEVLEERKSEYRYEEDDES